MPSEVYGVMWLKSVVAVGVVLVATYAAMLGYGAFRWNAGTRDIRERLEAGRVPLQPVSVDFGELAGLPRVVQRYLRCVLEDGQPMVAALSVRHSGSMNMSEAGEQWKPFTSEQRVIMRRPGFDWNATLSIMPGLPVRVHDAYVAGNGLLHAAALGLFNVANVSGTRDMAEGELLRFFAEAAWYPTALMPSQGVHWEGVDAHSARGTLRDGAIAVTLLFGFNEAGLLETVRAEARGRMLSGKPVHTPWQGRFWNYGDRSGMRVPLDGEVAWVLPEGAKPYWRGHVTDSTYELAP